MNKTDYVNLLKDLTIPHLSEGNSFNISETLEARCKEYSENIGDFQTISSSLENITKYYFSDPHILEWKYLVYNIYVLQKIGNIIENSNNTELLSVKEVKTLKTCILCLVKLGIYTKLQPKLPFHLNEIYFHIDDIFYQYNILKCTILAFCDFLKNDHLRVIVISESLRAILIGLYQLAYCPLKKRFDPIFTEDIYNKLLQEKELAVGLLQKLRETVYPLIYIKETMIIFQQNAPSWFKKAVSNMLTSIMLSPNGVENISVAILDGTGNDKTQTWRALDIIFRLISSCKNRLNFRQNICQQIVKLVDKTDEGSLVFERLFVTCTKNFYLEDKDLSKDVFVRSVILVLLRFTFKDHTFHEADYTHHINKSLRLLHAIFVEETAESPSLPIDLLKPVLEVIFRIYSSTVNSTFKSTSMESKALLRKYLNECPIEDNVVFDSFLFGICSPQNILPFRNDVILEIKGANILVKIVGHAVAMSTSERSEVLLKLLEDDTKLLTRFFRYLLRCLVRREKYFKKVDESLLNLETEVMNEYFDRSLVVFNVMSHLAEDKKVQNAVIESPGEIIAFVKDILERTLETNMHKTTEFECDGFQTVFTVIMISSALVTNSSKKSLQMFRVLEKPLKTIVSETKHKELSDLIDKMLSKIDVSQNVPTKIHIEESKSELDVILEDICDPLLPVRGHGLMTLRKLVEKKDTSVMEKKHYIFTIFQQNLKNDDSFIYLNAVDGLAAMANIFSVTVIKTLCEEYSDFARKDADGHEVRIKLGEVLVRVTKVLGDMAPKYKAVLLNTFLVGTKDEDHLVRASSLSNLGEICRVLGYKLGTVVTEVLVCVHAIIATDKAVEARRAAVTVIRQLLTGLESEMIVFLKEDILPIYRTLKQIYHNDRDDVMRLQAQLALEELNENMKNFVFPKQQLNMEKNIIMLN